MSGPAGRVAVLVLAAGGSRRFGGPTKQLAELAGRPLVAHVVDTALAAGEVVVVVVGHDAQQVTAVLPPAARVVVAQEWQRGMGASLAVGARWLRDEATDVGAVVVLLGDQPGITPEDVAAVAAAVLGGAAAARARWGDGPGHPVAFSPGHLPALAGLDGDVGARDLLGRTDTVEVPRPGAQPADVDRPDDLDVLRGDAGP